MSDLEPGGNIDEPKGRRPKPPRGPLSVRPPANEMRIGNFEMRIRELERQAEKLWDEIHRLYRGNDD